MNDTDMVKANWWMLTLRGVLLLLFGLAAVFWPGLTLATYVYIFSAFMLVGGIVGTITSLVSIGRKGWIPNLLISLLEMGVGLYLVRHPLVAFGTLILLLGFSFIVRGIAEIVSALMGDNPASSKTLVIIGGLLGTIIGVIILKQPVASGVAFVWLVGLYALVLGPITIALSFDAKNLATK